jgi:hypothetical protein
MRDSGRPTVLSPIRNVQLLTWETIVKVLSIRQPWAYLIVNGSKNIENRSWPTKYRGQLLVHASLNINREACRKHGLDPSKLQIGGIIGMAEIADCVLDHRSKWFEGPYGLVLRNRQPLPFVKWRGSLGPRDVPTGLFKRLGLPTRLRSIRTSPPAGDELRWRLKSDCC